MMLRFSLCGLALCCLSAPVQASRDLIATFKIREKCAEFDRQSRRATRQNRVVLEMSHEGSEITALILGGQTRKLHVTHLGTMGKQQETIYLENARPVWVTRIQTTYDAPLSGRTVERVEELLYFQNGQLIQRDLMPITFVNSIARRGKRWLHQTRITSPVQARQWESIACKWQQHVSHYKRALIRKD